MLIYPEGTYTIVLEPRVEGESSETDEDQPSAMRAATAQTHEKDINIDLTNENDERLSTRHLSLKPIASECSSSISATCNSSTSEAISSSASVLAPLTIHERSSSPNPPEPDPVATGPTLDATRCMQIKWTTTKGLKIENWKKKVQYVSI